MAGIIGHSTVNHYRLVTRLRRTCCRLKSPGVFLIFSCFSTCSSAAFPNTTIANNNSRETKKIIHSGAGVKQEESKRSVSSSELVALEFADLNLNNETLVEEEVGHVRIRQHVNPLSSAFQVPTQAPDWKQVFNDSSLPLMVDIGCGSGRFLLWLAKRFPETRNYLGLEIRRKLVQRAQLWVKELGLTNIRFLFANATISFDHIVSTYPGPLVFVSILCPDPHFKKKHHKRRVLQKPLVDSILKNLNPGGQVFLQSDVLDVALDMRYQFDAESNFLQHIDAVDPSFLCDSQGWVLSNPMGIRTEREIHAEFEGARMYRRMYQKKMQLLA